MRSRRIAGKIAHEWASPPTAWPTPNWSRTDALVDELRAFSPLCPANRQKTPQ